MATFFARGYRDELLQHRKKLRENPRVQEDVDHAWMALNLCVLEKKKPRRGGGTNQQNGNICSKMTRAQAFEMGPEGSENKEGGMLQGDKEICKQFQKVN